MAMAIQEWNPNAGAAANKTKSGLTFGWRKFNYSYPRLSVLIAKGRLTELSWEHGNLIRVLAYPETNKVHFFQSAGAVERVNSYKLALKEGCGQLIVTVPPGLEGMPTRRAEPVPCEIKDGVLIAEAPDWLWPESIHAARKAAADARARMAKPQPPVNGMTMRAR